MIKTIFKWLWDFNHVHEWTYEATHRTYSDVMGLKSNTEEIIYKCKCGEIKKL